MGENNIFPTFFSQVIVLNIFLKMLFPTFVIIRRLYLWYNKSNSRYTFFNKHFKVFLECEMYKDKPTPGLELTFESCIVKNYMITGNREHDRTPQNIWIFCITIKHKSSCKTFFLRYCKNITNFLFSVLWICLATSTENNNPNLQKCWCLSACKKRTPFLTSFLRYWKVIANCLLLWEFWECLIIPISNDSITLQETLMPKVLKQLAGSTVVYLYGKNQLHLTSFLKFVKILLSCYFRNFENDWAFPSKS